MMKRKGFTIIELLIGLGIFAVLSLTLYSVFSNSMRLQRALDQSNKYYQDVTWAAETLAMDLENMIPYHFAEGTSSRHEVRVNRTARRSFPVTISSVSGQQEEQDKIISFKGDNESLRLILPTKTGLKEVRYYLIDPSDGGQIVKTVVGDSASALPQSILVRFIQKTVVKVLVREVRPFPYIEEDEDSTLIDQEILCGFIQADGLKFSYAGYLEEQKTGSLEWQHAWQENYPPAGVRMQLSLIDPSGKEQGKEFIRNIFVPMGSWLQRQELLK